MGKRRFTDDEESRIVAAVVGGEPTKAVARAFGAPYETVRDVLRRHKVSLKAPSDPARLRERDRWRRGQRAFRARKAAS